MTVNDFAPLFRSTVGFDRLLNMAESAMQANQAGYPPYDIERIGEDRYAVTLAVAGFSRDELDIEAHGGVLTVTGRKPEQADEGRRMLHRGIATRAFQRRFQLADHVKVTGARLDNGLLTIDLHREVPEAAKPRRIAIARGAEDVAPAAEAPRQAAE